MNFADERLLNVIILLGLFGLTVWLWSTLVLYPVKLFVVLLHELSHGLAAALTGGEILSIEVNELIGGFCHYRGGNSLVVASAGYLGSLLWGGVILVVASRTHFSRHLAVVVSAVMVATTILWVRNLFGVYYTLGFGLLLLLFSRYLPEWLLRIVMQFLGTASCLYVIADIKEDLITSHQAGSDAEALAQLTGIPAIFWGILWGFVALVMIAYSFYLAGKSPRPAISTRSGENRDGLG